MWGERTRADLGPSETKIDCRIISRAEARSSGEGGAPSRRRLVMYLPGAGVSEQGRFRADAKFADRAAGKAAAELSGQRLRAAAEAAAAHHWRARWPRAARWISVAA